MHLVDNFNQIFLGAVFVNLETKNVIKNMFNY